MERKTGGENRRAEAQGRKCFYHWRHYSKLQRCVAPSFLGSELVDSITWVDSSSFTLQIISTIIGLSVNIQPLQVKDCCVQLNHAHLMAFIYTTRTVKLCTNSSNPFLHRISTTASLKTEAVCLTNDSSACADQLI